MLKMSLFLVIYLYLYFLFSSHKAGDYDCCDGLSETDCIKCNGEKNRILINGNTCMCMIGYFDVTD